MRFDVVFRSTVRDTLGCRGFVVPALKATEPYLKINKRLTIEVAVTLVGPTRIRALNKQYRNIDKSTDVLSFPLHQAAIKGYTALSLGDVFVCPAVVRAKAKLFGRSARDQMKWTLVHGLLHLAGYSHEKMAPIEPRILKRF